MKPKISDKPKEWQQLKGLAQSASPFFVLRTELGLYKGAKVTKFGLWWIEPNGKHLLVAYTHDFVKFMLSLQQVINQYKLWHRKK